MTNVKSSQPVTSFVATESQGRTHQRLELAKMRIITGCVGDGKWMALNLDILSMRVTIPKMLLSREKFCKFQIFAFVFFGFMEIYDLPSRCV